jgi:tRNA(Ile)-lysidine synthase
MKRSHPPALLTLARSTLHREVEMRTGDLVLLAVSGGPDSMALLHVLSRLAAPFRVTVCAHGVDHGLRKEAAEELALAARVAADLGVPFDQTRIEVAPGANLMARARAARFEALRGALARLPAPKGRRFLATAHHADDRAETVLLRILRGTGPHGLAVLPPRSGDLIRPIIRSRRADILAHLHRHRIPFAEDPTNRNVRFLRTRVRLEVLPLLRELSPRIVEHLCDLADAACDVDPAKAEAPPGAPGSVRIPLEFQGHRLGRAQRVALARALQTKNPRARVPLPGGSVARVDLSTGEIVLTNGE